MSGFGGGKGVLKPVLKDKALLYSSYMPFVQGGGLFVSSNKAFNIGDEVFMLISLMDEPEPLPVSGRVVWVTPPGSQGNRPTGVGVQFTDAQAGAQRKIETYLAGSLESDRPTFTM